MTMNLEDFVARSLSQIMAGIKKSQDQSQELNYQINPIRGTQDGSFRPDNLTTLAAGDRIPVHNVDFDIAVTAEDTEEEKGGIGVFSGVFGAGMQEQSGSVTATVSRLRFSIPVTFPPSPWP